MELTGLIPIIRRWILVIVVATGMAVLVGLLVGSQAQKTYEARAQIFVGPLSTDSNTIKASGDLAQTYAELATTGKVLGLTSRDTGVPVGELVSSVRATANSTTRFLVVRARSHDPKTASAVANTISGELVKMSRQDLTRPEGQLRVIDPAEQPDEPISPRLDLIVPLAATAGLLGSLTLILLFEFVGDTAESAEKVQAASGTRVISVRRRGRRPGHGREFDQLRIVATQAELAASPQLSCIVVTGIGRNDGSSEFAMDMARVWAERRDRVRILDAGTGEVVGLERNGGSDRPNVAHRRRDIGVAERRLPVVLDAAGTDLLPGTESLGIDDARRVIDDLVGSDGLLVVHAPPATLSAATLVWAQVADVSLLVVRRFQGRRVAIEETASNLRIVEARLPFTVLLDLPSQPWRRALPTRAASEPSSLSEPKASNQREEPSTEADGDRALASVKGARSSPARAGQAKATS